ncbi:MAG: SgcJ/EcaC family oxidoreductase [Gemmatimonadales bacterium]
MSHHRLLSAFVLLVTFAGCSPAEKAANAPADQVANAPADPTALRDTIQAREREWSAAFLAGNAAGVANLYTTDAAQVQARGDWVRGREGITKAMQAQFDTLAVTAREDITEEVVPAGDYIVEIGHYNYQGTSKPGNAPRSGAGRYMVLWRKDADGVWRLHRDIGNDAPPKKP